MFISIGELYILSRPQYHFVKMVNSKNKTIAIQHAVNTKYSGSLYNLKNEFNYSSKINNINFSPYPDYYLVQGNQFKELLSKFYPKNRIKVIGCLKHAYGPFKNKINFIQKNKKLILISFSANDCEYLCGFIKKIIITNDWKIIVTPHPSNNIDFIKEQLSISCKHLNYEFMSVPTTEILPKFSLIICGYSTLAYESAIFGVQSIRFTPYSIIPTRSGDKRILEFFDPENFNSWFLKNNKKLLLANNSLKLKTLAEDYFYKNDNNASNRLWNFINTEKKKLNSF